jgi:flagellar assembly factor FliW
MTDRLPEAAVIEFPGGLPGFEHHRRFVLVRAPGLDPFTMLQGLGPGAPAFAAVDPRHVAPGYTLDLEAGDRLRLEDDGTTPLVWLALAIVRDTGAVTVNLRAPLVINPVTLRGIQVIQPDAAYAFDHPLRAA